MKAINCIELGAGTNIQVVSTETDPEPPSNFIDRNVYFYRLVEGKKILKGIALYPGWDHQYFNPNCDKEDNTVAREDKAEKLEQAKIMIGQGMSINQAAQKLGMPLSTLGKWIKADRDKEQAPTPEPDQAANQEPEREEGESAGNSIPEPVNMPIGNSQPIEGSWDDFTAADDEPIPYMVAVAADHHDVADEISTLLDQKRADYGTENIKKFGSYGVLVRVSDKVERLINLSKKQGPVNFERVEDTWKDIAGYAILALIELREGR